MGRLAINRSIVRCLTVAGCVMLVSCATQPVADSEAELVSTPAFVRSPAADTEIIVTRDSGLFGSGGTPHVLIDGREAARLRPSQQVHLYLSAGDHVIAIANVYGDVQASAETVTRTERVRRFRISTGTGTYQLLPQ